ncbi:DUF3347 domain-containing protein [Robertkochia flava]|uniref:DUF3347 domain-containing protein n=1 Tax=Robertkochia flava TaxID=3447986 RepID=UPI001CCF7E65|nr:DUF3347 domain-containing protein [Robertkochia marina]
MKRVNKTLAALLMSGLVFTAFTSCGTEDKKKAEEAANDQVEMHDGMHKDDQEAMHNQEGMHEDHGNMNSDQQTAALEFKDEATAETFKAYIALKDALVATDAAAAATAASTLADKAGDQEALKAAAQTIAQSEDVEAQRKAFVAITAAVSEMMNGALTSGEVYRQYCPMAFNNTGASWISDNKEIMNPYFGDKMLHCGAVKETIK